MAFYQSTAGLASLIGVLLPLATTTVVLRFVARFRQKIGYGMDDFLLLPAWMSLVGLSALAIYGMINGFVAVPVPQDPKVVASLFLTFIKVYFTTDLLSVFAVGFTRLSAVFFYRRVFVTAHKWDAFGITTFVTIIVLILWILACALFQGFVCGLNFSYLFDSKSHPNCKSLVYLEMASLSSFILDLLVLIMPIPKIWSLHTTAGKKLAISMVFLLGAASLAASLVRVGKTYPNFLQGRTPALVQGKSGEDTFLKNTTLMYFIFLEAALCLTAVNLPSLWYFMSGRTPERVLKSIRSMVSLRSERSSRSKYQYDSEKGSALASHTDEHKSDRNTDTPPLTKNGITVVSEVDIH